MDDSNTSDSTWGSCVRRITRRGHIVHNGRYHVIWCSRTPKQGVVMAQRTITQLVDDIDDTTIEAGSGQTISFGLDGVGYAIDLANGHADELRQAFSRYVEAARKTGGSRVRDSASRSRRRTTEYSSV